MDHLISILVDNHESFIDGFLVTIELALLSCVIGLVIGAVLGVLHSLPSKIVRVVITVYVDIIRGIPLMVLAFFIFFGIPPLISQMTHTRFTLNEFVAGVIILTLNASAYFTEIVRSGIEAVPKGQKEAALSIGMTFPQTMIKVILPEGFRIMIPNFVSQFIITLKDTTIISAIGLVELLQAGRIVVGRTFDSMNTYFVVAVFYLVLISILSYIAKILERRNKLLL
jgi:polar amino acid transport system substrate-binding protein